MYVKLIKRNYLISNNDNNNILINSYIISKSNDVFQEIKKKEKIEVEKLKIMTKIICQKKFIKYEISFMLPNNENTDWKVNETYLKTNKTSQIIFNDLKLNPLFYLSDEINGKPIKIVVRIIPEPNKKIINYFRKEFGLSKETILMTLYKKS